MRTRVLVTDDDPDMRWELMGVLEGEGFDVEQAGNGFEAFKLLSEFKFELLLLDLKMPVMTGYELLQRLDASKIRIRTIVITGSVMDSPLPGEKSISYGEKKRVLRLADLVMGKPFQLPELIKNIKSLTSGIN